MILAHRTNALHNAQRLKDLSAFTVAAPLFAGRVAARLGTPPEKAEPAVDAVAAARAAVEQALGEPA